MRNCENKSVIGDGCRLEDTICGWRDALKTELERNATPEELRAFCRTARRAQGCLQFRELQEDINNILSSLPPQTP